MEWRFWKWFFRGLDYNSGLQTFMNRWFFAHAVVGTILAWNIEVPLYLAAQTILLPLSGIFIGLSFAWASSAQALLQKDEIQEFFSYLPGGIETPVYTFQLAVLVILVTLCLWGLAGLKVFSLQVFQAPCVQFSIKACLYFLASLTLRECWHVVLGSQILILVRHRAREAMDKKEYKDD